jgi:hypothetical protein
MIYWQPSPTRRQQTHRRCILVGNGREIKICFTVGIKGSQELIAAREQSSLTSILGQQAKSA